MNKRELARIYNTISQGKVSQKAALKEINIFTQTLQEALMKYDSVTFVNIGIFEILERKPRLVSNPSTREIMKIYPKKVVRFRASKNLIK
ncbi:HU family DNA-binding protein [Fusobacterium varium]|uniref:HU family DNA-binding protein n=1 Tax=Fusobacterium varium TaxID=856 RepID=UPI002430FDEF|nr:HU family DNA-binding protein [Fusobacterium varium]MCF0171270.1 HU family DNA-binding protein [Fusobacterium varium]